MSPGTTRRPPRSSAGQSLQDRPRRLRSALTRRRYGRDRSERGRRTPRVSGAKPIVSLSGSPAQRPVSRGGVPRYRSRRRGRRWARLAARSGPRSDCPRTAFRPATRREARRGLQVRPHRGFQECADDAGGIGRGAGVRGGRRGGRGEHWDQPRVAASGDRPGLGRIRFRRRIGFRTARSGDHTSTSASRHPRLNEGVRCLRRGRYASKRGRGGAATTSGTAGCVSSRQPFDLA